MNMLGSPPNASGNNWRDLDVAQIVHWPDVPRRFFLALCAVLLAAALAWFLLVPMYEALNIEKNQTKVLQQQYIQMAQHVARNDREKAMAQSHGIKAIPASGLPAWLSEFAKVTQAQHFSEVSVKPIYDTPSSSNAGGGVSGERINQLLDDPNVGILMVSGVGQYDDLLNWATVMSVREEVLGVDEMTLTGDTAGRVRWQARVFFAQEVKP